ncbi:MAG: MinD/ParA family protein [Planctomycetota bacterium]
MNGVADQASELRALMADYRPVARVLAVTSGKGGVGKTNIAVALGLELARRGRKTVLFDADLGLANVDVILGIEARANLSHVVGGRARLSDVAVPLPGGLTVVPAASGVGGMADLDAAGRDRLLAELETLEARAEVMILDTGAGISQAVMPFVLHADEILVVTTPEPTALADAYALIKLVVRRRPGARFRLIVNRVAGRDEAAAVSSRLVGVCRRFLGAELADGGYVVEDAAVGASVRRRRPFLDAFPSSPASRCIRGIARFWDGGRPEPDNGRKGGFFRSLFSFAET